VGGRRRLGADGFLFVIEVQGVTTYRTPGVYREEVVLPQPRALRTGVPALIGYATTGPVATPAFFELWLQIVHLLRAGEAVPDELQTRARLDLWPDWALQASVELWPAAADAARLTLWPAFTRRFGQAASGGYLAHAVRGFFANGGSACYVLRLDHRLGPEETLREALAALEQIDDVDLVCAPDVARPPLGDVAAMQNAVLQHCDRLGDRFAVLDAPPSGTIDVAAHREALRGSNGALYYPWIAPLSEAGLPAAAFVPPCGHVAGVYARSDDRFGVHKAPANELVEGVVDLERNLSDDEQGDLNVNGINALRTFRGRGIRVWGARTLSRDEAWRYVNVRRIFLTAARWIELSAADQLFEPNDAALWTQIRLALNRYFAELFRRGALRGASEEEAFYVKCDADTNPPEVRDAGRVVAEIGLAPTRPNEFVVVRITRHAGGVSIIGPTPG